MEFSIVIPIAERDFPLIHRSLPSWLALGSDDVILCLDKPASRVLLEGISRSSSSYGKRASLRIVEVERSNEWTFHQAHARRAGFEMASHDAILTGDIDLIVRRNVLNLARAVGTKNVGLASCPRVPAPLSFPQVLRALAYFVKQRLQPPIFSGLYAMWRPYWRETEDEGIRHLKNPRISRYETGGLGILGEDTYLFLCMRRLHRCVNLDQIGAISLTRNVEDLPEEQYSWGRYVAGLGVNPLVALAAATAFAYPYFLKGYLYQRKGNRRFSDPYDPDFQLIEENWS